MKRYIERETKHSIAMEYTHAYLLLSYRPSGRKPIWHR